MKIIFFLMCYLRSQRVGIIGAVMLIKHIVLLSPNEESISIDRSNDDILLTKKAKEAYSLIGNIIGLNLILNFNTIIFCYRIIGNKNSIRYRFSNFVF